MMQVGVTAGEMSFSFSCTFLYIQGQPKEMYRNTSDASRAYDEKNDKTAAEQQSTIV